MSKSHMTTPKIAPALLRVMGEKEWTVRELTDATGYSFDGVNDTLRKMEAYICGWRPQRGAVPSAVWKLGQGTHVPRPPAQYKKWANGRTPQQVDAARLSRRYVTGERVWGI